MRPCPNHPGYFVTQDGRVFSGRRGTVRELAQTQAPKGYLNVGVVRADGERTTAGVHRLVAEAYLGPPSRDANQVRHLDGNPTHNHKNNLAWGTDLENAADRLRHGRYARGGKHHNAKLSDTQAAQIRSARARGMKVKALAERFGVSVPTVESIIYGKAYLRWEKAEVRS